MKPYLILMIALLLAGFASGPGHAFRGKQKTGVEQLHRMAEQGDPAAMADLGEAYYNGREVLKDPFKAKCWVQRAREAGLALGDDQTVSRTEGLWNRLELWQYAGECSQVVSGALGPAKGDRFVEPVTGMAFVWIPGRCFFSHARQGGKGSGLRKVCPDGFWMGQYEVTQAQWMKIMPANPSRFKGDDLPVEQVSYGAVQDFIRGLNQVTGRQFALPTQIQWEFACTDRGRRQAFSWGREKDRPQANCGGCDPGRFRGKTAPVGSFPPSPLGLSDMGGNVREWCRDDVKGRHRDRPKDKPVRGGSFVDNVNRSECRAQDRLIPGMRAYYLGFRLAAERLD